jgi:hypothetical protein
LNCWRKEKPMRTAVTDAAALALVVSSASFALADGTPGNPGPARDVGKDRGGHIKRRSKRSQ